MTPWLTTFLGGATLKLIALGMIGFVVGVVMSIVNGARMVQNMTEAARKRYIWRGFPLFLPDDAFLNEEGREYRNKMHAWLMGTLLAWLVAFALMTVRFYILHCAGWNCVAPS